VTKQFLALSDFCTIIQGGRHGLSGNDFVSEGYPAYGAGGLNGFLDTYEFEHPAVILSSIGARCGKCFYASGRWSSLANTQVIVPDENKADPRFLWFQLNDEGRWHRSGTGQPFIKPSDVKAHRVFLPPIEDQRRIAAILDQADALRTKRREALALLDELQRGIFVDMFGDPVANPKGWERVSFQSLLEEIEGGWSPNCLDRPAAHGEWGVLKLGAVTQCEYREAENKALPPDIEAVPALEVKPGDLLFSRKNTYDLVGACALVGSARPRLLIPDLIFRLRLREGAPIEKRFLHQLLVFPTKRKEIQKLASGSSGSMPNISKGRLSAASIELPPLSLQQEFAKKLDAVAAQKVACLDGLIASNELVASLQHRAFRGEL